ncbi:hypothetical protein HPP92_001534 [Vanilla planifolia]|uniref:SANTA domain-containing protein n=1 Tax=Vanilla planifolia TaxID=51239 RepID=A0A835SC47_VANPL|nr:hypothetical protein HPP92_001534 [Vanilla planifolia]
MTLRLQGFIDKIITFNNGFTHEVCRNFLVGFPITWANVVNESSSGKPCYSETPASASTGTEWAKGSPEKMSFQFPIRSENRVLDDVPSSPSAVATDSFAGPRKSKSMAHSLMPMKVRSPLFEGDSHQTPEKSTCSNVPQDDETRGTKISTSPIVRLCQAIQKFMAICSKPKKIDIPTANGDPHHMPEKSICANVPSQDDKTTGTKIRNSYVDTEGEGYQTVSSHVNRAPLENPVDHVKLDLTRGAIFRNNDMCSEHPLSKGQHVKRVETCTAGVSWDSTVENNTEKEEMMQSKHQKFDKSTNKRVTKLGYDLLKPENLLGEYQKFPKYSVEPIRRSKRLNLSSVVDEDCQGYSQSDCMPNNLKYSNLSTDGFKTTDMRQHEHNSAKGSLFSPTKVPFSSGGDLTVENGDCHQQSRNMHEDGIVDVNPTRTKVVSSQTSERRMTRLEAKKKNVQTDKSGMKERKVEVSGDIPQSVKASSRTGRKTVWVTSYKNVGLASLSRIKEKKLSILTPDSLNLKRSRSGRVLVPRLDCSMRIVYDADGSISGTALIETSTTASKGSRSNPTGTKAKKRRLISSSR